MTTKGENHCIAMHFITIYIPAGLSIGCMLMLIVTDEHPVYPYSATDVARCRDGDALKYDAAECSPGLLSMEWYPSIIVPGCRRMFTSVGEHGMVSHLVPGFFSPVGFSMQAHVFFRDTWHAPSLHHFLFLWKMFLLPFMIMNPFRVLWHMTYSSALSLTTGLCNRHTLSICIG